MARNSSFPAGQPPQANPVLKSYYDSLESRIGYRLVLGGTRHFGYYEDGTWWPFPIGPALRKMEEKLYQALGLPAGSQVMDSGCGVGHVAIYMARQGLRVTAFDIVDHHVYKARRNVAASGLPPGQVTVDHRDYHHLEAIPDESHDGIYTMETLVHAADPEMALAGFYRILRPGGRLAMHEYDNDMHIDQHIPKDVVDAMDTVNNLSFMPTNARSHRGVLKALLEDAGFVDVKVVDYSKNITPMLRLFYWLAIIPYLFVRFFRLDRYFVNTVAGAQGYHNQKHWRYLSITANKPGTPAESSKTK